MNKLTIPSPSNGIKHFWEDLEYILGYGSYDSGLVQAIESILLAYGTDFIVSGCEDLGANVTADGWIMLGSTLIRVKQHTRTNNYFVATTEVNSTGARTDNLGGSINVYEQNRAECTGATGNLHYLGIRLNEILGLNITTRAITAAGTYNIVNNEKKITVVSSASSATTINLPTPSTYNKGQVYYFHMTYTGSGTLTIVGESGNLKSYPGQAVSGILGFMNDGTTWLLVCEKITATTSLAGITKLASSTEKLLLTSTTSVTTAKDVGDIIKSDFVEYSTSGTKSPASTIGVIKVTVSDVTINMSADIGKKQELLLYIGSSSDFGSVPVDCILNYSDDGLVWYELLDINAYTYDKLYHFVNDGTTWRWTISDYVEQT